MRRKIKPNPFPEYRIINRHTSPELGLQGRIVIVRDDVVRFYPSIPRLHLDATESHHQAWKLFPEFRIFEICYYGLGIREWMERRAQVSNPEDYFNVFMEVLNDYIRQGKLSGNINER